MWDRVVVGVDGSLASLAALRQAVAEARRDSAALHVVWVWGRQVVGHVTVAASIPNSPRLIMEGQQRVADAFACSLGSYPADVAVTIDVRAYEGNAGAALVGIADRDRDLLVIGAGIARRRLHPFGHAVGRYCLRHARCVVLVVPPSELAQTIIRHPGQAKRLPRRLLRAVARPAPKARDSLNSTVPTSGETEFCGSGRQGRVLVSVVGGLLFGRGMCPQASRR